MVFNGTLGYRPNLDAALHLVDDIWPLVRERHPDARLTIVGRGSEADCRRLRRPGVIVTGEVPDVRPYLRDAAVVVVPVRMGGGTRLKVVEGLAMGKAMVSTTVGCEGVGVRDRDHLLIADGAEDFAAAVLRLFADTPLADRLGAAGRGLIESEYSWELAGERMEALYEQVIGSLRPHANSASAARLTGGTVKGSPLRRRSDAIQVGARCWK
jgi:polysaccharide biosynthesis protein PslH